MQIITDPVNFSKNARVIQTMWDSNHVLNLFMNKMPLHQKHLKIRSPVHLTDKSKLTFNVRKGQYVNETARQ